VWLLVEFLVFFAVKSAIYREGPYGLVFDAYFANSGIYGRTPTRPPQAPEFFNGLSMRLGILCAGVLFLNCGLAQICIFKILLHYCYFDLPRKLGESTPQWSLNPFSALK